MWFRGQHRIAGRPGECDEAPVAAHHAAPPATVELPALRRLATPFKPAPGQLARNLVIGPAAPGEVNAAYNLLRTQIFKHIRGTGWNTIAITSPNSAAGTTLTAINLAISIARDLGHNVLLAELNFINPGFRDIFGFERRPGIVDHLLHDVPVAEILLDPGIDRLMVMPAGPSVANSSELLASPKMARLVHELKGHDPQRIVLFDLPPVLLVDDAMAFSPLVDCALLVAEEGGTRIKEVQRALDYMGSTNMLGVVLNRAVQLQNNSRLLADRVGQSRHASLTDQSNPGGAPAITRLDRGVNDGRSSPEPWVARNSRGSSR